VPIGQEGEIAITQTQFQYYRAIRDFVSKHGWFPTYGEIGRMVGVTSCASVSKVMQKLLALGLVIKQDKGYALVPEKLHGLSQCARGHLPIWFMARTCPVCELLARIPKAC
jgi:hypothetical protein